MISLQQSDWEQNLWPDCNRASEHILQSKKQSESQDNPGRLLSPQLDFQPKLQYCTEQSSVLFLNQVLSCCHPEAHTAQIYVSCLQFQSQT